MHGLPAAPASRPIPNRKSVVQAEWRGGIGVELRSSPRRALTCISHRTLRVALWRRLFSLPRRLSSRRMDREPLPPHVSAGVPRRQPKRLRREQLAPCRLKGDEKSRLNVFENALRSLTLAALSLAKSTRPLPSGFRHKSRKRLSTQRPVSGKRLMPRMTARGDAPAVIAPRLGARPQPPSARQLL